MNKKIIQRSLNIAYQIFPQVYSQKTKYRTFHFAFAWKKNELLSIGQNRPNFPNSKALKFAKRFKTQRQIKYPYLHAEIDMISKIWSKIYIDNNIKVCVIRINKNGELQNSKPCKSCAAVFKALNIHKVWWTEKGTVKSYGA